MMIGNRKEDGRVWSILLHRIWKDQHPARIDWQGFWAEKSLSPFRDSNLACPNRMPSLFHLRHLLFFLSNLESKIFWKLRQKIAPKLFQFKNLPLKSLGKKNSAKPGWWKKFPNYERGKKSLNFLIKCNSFDSCFLSQSPAFLYPFILKKIIFPLSEIQNQQRRDHERTRSRNFCEIK